MSKCTLATRKCLVLNKNWTPVHTITLEDAMSKLFGYYEDGTPKAKIIDPSSYQTFTWNDWKAILPSEKEDRIVTVDSLVKIPEIILLTRYMHVPRPKVHFSRRTLYKRDKMTCQYCLAQPGSEELTIDHVVPRSKGGQTTWENCVLACVECNRMKRDLTPKQAGMKLHCEPKRPASDILRIDNVKPIKSWQAFIGEMYWEVELQNDNLPD